MMNRMVQLRIEIATYQQSLRFGHPRVKAKIHDKIAELRAELDAILEEQRLAHG